MLGEFRSFLQLLPEVSNITESNGDITFQYKGLNFLFVWNEKDTSYIRLMLPKIASTSDLKSGVDLLTTLSDYNKKYKVAKMFIIEDYLWLTMEQFVYSREGIQDLFMRIVNILVLIVDDFRKSCL